MFLIKVFISYKLSSLPEILYSTSYILLERLASEVPEKKIAELFIFSFVLHKALLVNCISTFIFSTVPLFHSIICILIDLTN